MTIHVYLHLGSDLAESLDRLEKGQQQMAATIADVKAVADRLVSDVKRISADMADILDKLSASNVTPDQQPLVDEMNAAADELEAGATAAEQALNPPTPPTPVTG